MNHPAHTPGPWIVSDNALDPENTVLDGKRGKRVGRHQICVANGYSSDEAAANARLICAAPELLAALKRALVAVEYYHAHEGANYLVEDCLAAIAKAEGAR